MLSSSWFLARQEDVVCMAITVEGVIIQHPWRQAGQRRQQESRSTVRGLVDVNLKIHYGGERRMNGVLTCSLYRGASSNPGVVDSLRRANSQTEVLLFLAAVFENVVVDLDAEQARPASIAIPDLLDDSILLNSVSDLHLFLLDVAGNLVDAAGANIEARDQHAPIITTLQVLLVKAESIYFFYCVVGPGRTAAFASEVPAVAEDADEAGRRW
ncbi:hypothetical protein IFM51744_00751 [Aspergillus udagawae]|uniref:Uncharacterized protein n=1 Tax=Aspergillus udagawae TaxID=91492 RepID=A0ABQ1AZP2_9EURO|nr:hypothetical protein IFM51744_00751 [Aspergillus udagawae]GFF91021.1 hypothetical protein IFM53868_06362 [Aspergillus udagawae]